MSKMSQKHAEIFDFEAPKALCANCGKDARPRFWNRIKEIVCSSCKSYEDAQIELADLNHSGRAY